MYPYVSPCLFLPAKGSPRPAFLRLVNVVSWRSMFPPRTSPHALDASRRRSRRVRSKSGGGPKLQGVHARHRGNPHDGDWDADAQRSFGIHGRHPAGSLSASQSRLHGIRGVIRVQYTDCGAIEGRGWLQFVWLSCCRAYQSTSSAPA